MFSETLIDHECTISAPRSPDTWRRSLMKRSTVVNHQYECLRHQKIRLAHLQSFDRADHFVYCKLAFFVTDTRFWSSQWTILWNRWESCYLFHKHHRGAVVEIWIKLVDRTLIAYHRKQAVKHIPWTPHKPILDERHIHINWNTMWIFCLVFFHTCSDSVQWNDKCAVGQEKPRKFQGKVDVRWKYN